MDLRDIIELNRQLDLGDPEALNSFVVLTKVQLLEIKEEDPEYYHMYLESLEAYFYYREESGREVVYKDDKNQSFEDLNVNNPLQEEEIIRQEIIESTSVTEQLENLSDADFNLESVKSQRIVTRYKPSPEPDVFQFSESIQATDPLAKRFRFLISVGAKIEEIIDNKGQYTYIVYNMTQIAFTSLEEIDEIADIKQDRFNTKYIR
tara:strand:+ start:268 stop:885 length:618 start_codon:yes stop_codon:yes gene_type:complete